MILILFMLGLLAVVVAICFLGDYLMDLAHRDEDPVKQNARYLSEIEYYNRLKAERLQREKQRVDEARWSELRYQQDLAKIDLNVLAAMEALLGVASGSHNSNRER